MLILTEHPWRPRPCRTNKQQIVNLIFRFTGCGSSRLQYHSRGGHVPLHDETRPVCRLLALIATDTVCNWLPWLITGLAAIAHAQWPPVCIYM